MAMSVMENTDYESYLDNLSQRLVKPNMVMIWSTWHPLFPQVNFRILCFKIALKFPSLNFVN